MNRIHRSAGLRSSTTLLQATTAEEQCEEAAAVPVGGAVRRYCPRVDEVDRDNLHMCRKLHLQQPDVNVFGAERAVSSDFSFRWFLNAGCQNNDIKNTGTANNNYHPHPFMGTAQRPQDWMGWTG